MASLSDDLSALRKKLDLTIRDVYDATRIPIDVIEEIESGFIFSPECTRNKTYIRSFVRTYSKALKITDDEITQALDLHDRAAYDGFLSKLKNVEVSSSSKTDNKETSIDKFQVPITSRVGVDYENEYSRPDPTRTHNKSTPRPPEIGTVNWADMGNRFANLPKASIVPIVVFLIVIGISIGGYFTYSYWQENAKSKPVVLERKVVDIPEIPQVETLIEEEITTPESEKKDVEPVQIKAVLPDTLEILIWAKNDKLEPVRVKTEDTGIQNPYWIENNQAMRVTFTKSLSLRGQYNRMALIFNGHEFIDFNRFKSEDGQFVIERSFFNDSFWLTPVSMDSLEVKPARIYDRPSFPTN